MKPLHAGNTAMNCDESIADHNVLLVDNIAPKRMRRASIAILHGQVTLRHRRHLPLHRRWVVRGGVLRDL